MTTFGVIFDMDGVLVDSSNAHLRAFQAFGERIGVPFTEETFRKSFGLHNDEIFPLWLGPELAREKVISYAAEKEEIYRQLAPKYVRPVKGVTELIDSLLNQGAALAVGSSGPRKNVELALKIVGRSHAFRTVVTGDDVERGKPAPDIFLKAASLLGLSPKECVVIEDAPAGIEAALAAQIKVIAVPTSFPPEKLGKATLMADSMGGITPEAIRSLLKRA